MGTYIGLLELDLNLPAASSLKDKRRVIKSLVQRIRNRFNASVKEISAQDLIQRSLIGIGQVSSSQAGLKKIFNEIIDFSLTHLEVELIDSKIHIFCSTDDE